MTEDTIPGKVELLRHPDPFYNGEPAVHLLTERLTPADLLFVRNNGVAPPACADPDSWTLTVDGATERSITLSLGALRRKLPVCSITTVMECAGNGRSLLSRKTDGIPWRLGAVGCLTFEGFRMGDVLALAGLQPQAHYVGHVSPDVTREGKPALSRGLPLAKALAPETLLAFRMNGEPLPHAHGGPLRVVAPGYPGSAWQKWVNRLWVRDCEHDGARMTGLDYRLPRVPVPGDGPYDPKDFDIIEAMPPRALVTSHAADTVLQAGSDVDFSGWAWGHGDPVVRVDVGLADRPTVAADLEPVSTAIYAWQAFRVRIRIPEPGTHTLVVRAFTASGAAQPLLEGAWNPKGYCNNGCQRLVLVAV